MKNSCLLKVIAAFTVGIFVWDQIVFAEGVMPYESYQTTSSQPAAAGTSFGNVSADPLATNTTTAFLAASASPLSSPETALDVTDSTKTYGVNGELRTELALDGHVTRHIYAGESIQPVIEQSSEGDTVFIHAGTYHERVVIKQGVGLKGEDNGATVLDGDSRTGVHVIRALGNNRIEGLTITGGGPYSGMPSSAIRVEGDNVKIRKNRVVDNQDYGIHVWSGTNTLIEQNFFTETHVGVQLPKDSTVIRYNTFVKCDIAVNVLMGAKPFLSNNVFTESTFSSIHEFSWDAYSKGQPSRGYLIAENNTFWKNTEKGTYYGSATPFSVEKLQAGNLKANPLFANTLTGDYTLQALSSSQGRGSFLTEALTAALDRASNLSVSNTIQNIMDGICLVGYRILYDEGSTEDFYIDGARVFDTTPPQILTASEPVFTNQSDYEWIYTVDGIEQRKNCRLNEGENVLTAAASDIFGNSSSQSMRVTLDRTSPSGTLKVNGGAAETDSRAVVLSVEGSDNFALKDVRFSADQGQTWTEWAAYSGMKVLMLSEGEGEKEVLCELRDAAGNTVSFSDKILFLSEPAMPVVSFLSSNSTSDPLYLSRYTVDGVERQEMWRLSPGGNHLMLSVSRGTTSKFTDRMVFLNQPETTFPDVPSRPAASPADLVLLTTQEGSILGYSGGVLFSIEKPGEYSLYYPEFNPEGELQSGTIFFENGDRLRYLDGKALCRVNSSGEKILYNEDGTIGAIVSSDYRRIRFCYKLDDAGRVVGVIASDPEATGLYDQAGKPVWIKKLDLTEMFYEEGFLSVYIDRSRNTFRYSRSILQEGLEFKGYRVELTSVTPVGSTERFPLDEMLAAQEDYPFIQATLAGRVPRSIEYDVSGNIVRVISVNGEALELRDGLPVSFTGYNGVFSDIGTLEEDGQRFFVMDTGEDDFEQIFGDDGKLSELRLTDGTVFKVTGTKLDRIELEDGRSLTQLRWDGQDLTGFTLNHLDGSKDIYQQSRLVMRQDPLGNLSSFYYTTASGYPQSITMGDGRRYVVSELTRSSENVERLMELSSILLPDGAQVRFQDGKASWISGAKPVVIDPMDVPTLLEGRFYVPLIQLSNAELRELTVDQNGTIYSGQILFYDGTQYFIEDQKIVKQVTAFGQLIEIGDEVLPPGLSLPGIDAAPLTVTEKAYRDQLVETQLDYFTDGKGLHAGTGLPVDHYLGPSGQQSNYSQSTLVGFWAEILSSIARGDHLTTKMSQAEAFSKLEQLLASYREVQRQAGWNGMVAFFYMDERQEAVLDDHGDPTGEFRTVYQYRNAFNQVGFGDVLNLSVSLASVIGALEELELSPDLSGQRDSILQYANLILADQEAGYAAFYDPVVKRFHGAYGLNPSTGKWEFINKYYIDRVFNEFRTGMVWLVSRYPQYADALKNLDVALRPYETRDGKAIDLAVPYDGGSFQMFWPLIHIDETQYPEFQTALRNFLYAQADFVNAQGIPGLLSAGDEPLNGYQGKIGLADAAEADDRLLMDIGSLYGTAAAFPLAPHYTLQFLKNIQGQYPGIVTPAGFVDAVRLKTVTSTDPATGQFVSAHEAVYADQFYGVDQASFILSLLKTSQTYFGNYLRKTGSWQAFDELYRSFEFNLAPVTEDNPAPPDLGQEGELLYEGNQTFPDGLSAGLLKQPAFVSMLLDPELGEGRVYNYVTAGGEFHHIEIEFGEGAYLRRMNLQEYLLSPKHAGAATALLGGLELDILNRSSRKGVFFTPGYGYSKSGIVVDPEVGQAQRLEFSFEDPGHPVGIWADYSAKDFSEYDFFSVPVKLERGTSEKIRLKFEFKGMGEIFVTAPLTPGWNYLSIPVPSSPKALSQLAISIQPCDGQPVEGMLFLGPLSALKIRTSSQLDWNMLLGKTGSEIRALVLKSIAAGASGSAQSFGQDVLENFIMDAEGRIVSGVMKLANGDIQYFQNGTLVKWIFKSGRTVLFENGLASFVIDLARGKLETGRFYYDQNLRGEIRSFVLRDNESERVFSPDGKLKSFTQGGCRISYEGDRIRSIRTAYGTLIDPEFSSDNELLRARVLLLDGTEFDIDQTQDQTLDIGGAVKITCEGGLARAIETPQNGRTELQYSRDVMGRIMGVAVSFREAVADPQTGESQIVTRQMSLFDYLQRPERSVEKSILLDDGSFSVLEDAFVTGFSEGPLPSGELTQGESGDYGFDSLARYRFRYAAAGAATLGLEIRRDADPVNISSFHFLAVTLRQDPSMTWAQDFYFKVKSPVEDTLCSFEIRNLANDYQTFAFPLSDKTGIEGELDLEVLREGAGVGESGTVYLKDIAYIKLRTFGEELWENRIGISAAILQGLKADADQLVSVGAKIASRSPFILEGVAALFDAPTQLSYQGTSSELGRLVSFRRFDGSQVELDQQGEVTRVVLANGIVNEYQISGNVTEGSVRGFGEDPSTPRTVSYRYGALRRIVQPDGQEFLLSYESDADGKEITVFKDVADGTERRFRDGKLISSDDPEELQTTYTYSNGKLSGAQLIYHGRTLQSTQYSFDENGTQVTDEQGTTWFYDADGYLVKHMTWDGYFYEYSDYTQELPQVGGLPGDYKDALYTASDLRAVSLKGYEAEDGSWIRWSEPESSEIHLASGTQGVNLEFDEAQRIRRGQIQFPDGMILEIENFIPVRGRYADGQVFDYGMSLAGHYELLQDEAGAYQGFRLWEDQTEFTYNAAGELVSAGSGDGITNAFSYQRDANGFLSGYARTERRQLSFGGVPFPKEAGLIAGADQKLIDSGQETAVHEGPGFLAAVYKEATNQWDAYSGTFASAADRLGLEHFLSDIRPGEFIAMVVSDPDFSMVDEATLTLLEGLGAGQVRLAATGNQPWSFLGNETLQSGQGAEQVGGTYFSTVTETTSMEPWPADGSPLWLDQKMFFEVPERVARHYSEFLIQSRALRMPDDLQSMTVYNARNEIVFSRRSDGANSYYEHGKVRETFDRDGVLLSVQEYDCPPTGCASDEVMTLKKITLVKARQDFEGEAARLYQQIEQAKFDALYKLAWQDEVTRLQIKENVDAGLAAINAQIVSLVAQRFQTVKQCRRVLFWKSCQTYTYEVPGVQAAIHDLEIQRAELLITGEAQLAAVPGAVASKKIEIEQATAEKLAELALQRESFLLDILHQEMEPIITDFYRRILGRDASNEEFDHWVGCSQTTERLDLDLLRSSLENSEEKTLREAQKALIIQGVRDFLEDYLASSDETRESLLGQISLNRAEVVSLSEADMAAIVEWLETRDLHFGQSAFLSLQRMLASEGVKVAIEEIGKETILIDILTGTINRFTEGDLLISVFALDRVAKIHQKDFATVQYSYQDMLSLFQSVCPDMQSSCEMRVIAHVGEDHFVVVKRVTETEVVYEETGKGVSGEEIKAGRDDFLRIWQTKDKTGYLLVSESRAMQSKKVSDHAAMKIRGAFFFIFFVVSFVLTVASMVVSTFSPTFGKILGYAALVAGIIAIVGSLGQFIVQGVKMVFSSITTQGLFATIKQGILHIGKVLFESVKSVGRFVQKAFTFIKGGFTGGLKSLGAGLMKVKDFLLKPSVDVIRNGQVVGLKFSFGQIAARSLVAVGLNWAVSQGLEGLGLDPQLTQLAAAFVGGGFLGIGQAGTSFLRSGLSLMITQGVSQMAAHLGLAPPFVSVLSIAGDLALSSLFDANFNLKTTLTSIAPTLASKITLGSLDLLGRSLGLDPRLTQLLGLPLSAIVGNVTAHFSGEVLGYRDDGTPIYVTSPYDAGSLWDSIKNSLLTSVQQMRWDFGGAASNSLFGSLLTGDVLISLGSLLGKEGVFQGILDVLKTAILAPFNLVQTVVQETLREVRDFRDLIREKGLLGALEAFAGVIFSRSTLERLLGLGGISGLWDPDHRTLMQLPNGQQVQEQSLGGAASLLFDMAGNFIGKKENGVIQVGTFGINASGKWALLAGAFFSEVAGGYAFAGEVSEGQLRRGKLYAGETLVGEFLPQEGNGTIVIDGANPDAVQYDSQAGFWGMVFKIIPYAMDFVFSNGLLQSVSAAVGASGGVGGGAELLYVLANGIGNNSGGVPLYIRKLEYDLFQKSEEEVIPGEDTLPISLYLPTLGNDLLDTALDALKWALESQDSKSHFALAMDALSQLADGAVSGSRPITAMGFSGGLLPLVEALAAGGYNVTSLIGLGAATLSVVSGELLDALLAIIDFVQSSIGKVLGWLTGALDAVLRTLLGKLHLDVLNVGHLADELVSLVSRGSSLAIDKLREIIAVLPKVPAWNFPDLAAKGAQVFVNIYGTQDILYQTGISGYRENLFGFSAEDEDHPLFNIEIKGAEHLYYMKRNDLPDPEWNTIVSDFVTRLMLNSDSPEQVKAFLNDPANGYPSCIRQEGSKWVIELPGWQARE